MFKFFGDIGEGENYRVPSYPVRKLSVAGPTSYNGAVPKDLLIATQLDLVLVLSQFFRPLPESLAIQICPNLRVIRDGKRRLLV